MKVKVRRAGGGRPPRRLTITGDFIRLDALLKYASLAQTGGEAKIYIQEGLVAVNGAVATQRGRKIRPGDIVTHGGETLMIAAGPEDVESG